MTQTIVIVGAGQAGLQAVATLRAEGFSGSIVLIGDEPFAPYQRPPLSKAYLLGKMERPRLFLKAESFYASACTFVSDARATAVVRDAHAVVLADGRRFAYDKLLLATGTRAKLLACPGADLPGVHTLRSIADVDALRPAIAAAKRAVIVGAGYIGLEVAAVAAKSGIAVTVIEFLDRVLARSVSPAMSDFFAAEHRAHGVELVTETGVEAFEGRDRLQAVLAGGKRYPADFALIGVGAIPNVELARAAGLTCDNGIVVDAFAATSDPDIFAAGDCARHRGRDGVWRRLESVQNAIDQAKHAALAMIGKPKPYAEVPWFWSDQYDLKLQIAGIGRDGDRIVRRGGPADRKFAEFALRDGVLAAATTVNLPADHLMARRLIAAGARPSAEALADPTVPLKTLM